MNSPGSNPKSREFQNRIARIEELIHAIDAMPDEAARSQTRELTQALLDLHGHGLNRALEIVFDSSADGQALINKLAEDDLVSKLLLLHGLHPLDLETRVRQAIEEVKPRLGLHGGSVQLVEVTARRRSAIAARGKLRRLSVFAADAKVFDRRSNLRCGAGYHCAGG